MNKIFEIMAAKTDVELNVDRAQFEIEQALATLAKSDPHLVIEENAVLAKHLNGALGAVLNLRSKLNLPGAKDTAAMYEEPIG